MAKEWGKLKIDDHRMWASLTLEKPEGEDVNNITEEYIHQYLKDNGIVYGIIEGAVAQLAGCAPYEKEIIVAKGTEPENGIDGTFRFLVPLEDAKSKPVVNEDGSVDYKNSLKLAMVEEGETFAVYVPPTEGKEGRTIFDEVVKPVPGKDQRLLRGKGFDISEDKKEYTASFSGRIYKDNERIIIDKIYVVNGDLHLEHGNINFNGDVEIMGDVRSGLEIHAEGSIFIHGHVGGCRLEALKNITIEKGVQGKDACVIRAGGDVAGSFIERCRIKAEGNVYANSILDCQVFARNQVIVVSKTGRIIGGEVVGVQGVVAKEIGNEAGTTTIVRFMEVAPYLRRLSKISEELKKLSEEVGVFEQKLKAFDKIEGSKMTKELDALRLKVVRAKVICTSKTKELGDERIRINEEIRVAAKNARVEVTSVVYAGAKIMASQSANVVQESFRQVVFICKNGNVEMLDAEEAEKLKKLEEAKT